MRRRFLVPSDLITGSSVTLDGDLYRHIAKVLRLQPGAGIILCNGKGVEYDATLTKIDRSSVSMTITAQRTAKMESSAKPSFTLLQGLPKGDKFELIIQKATELGINSIIGFPASHSVVKIDTSQIKSRITRWQKIAAEAARQSERYSIPEISLANNMKDALHETTSPVKILLSEREKIAGLRETLEQFDLPESVSFLVGPEGGFSIEEIEMAMEAGFMPVSLGPRILRTETAGLAALSILQYQLGDMR